MNNNMREFKYNLRGDNDVNAVKVMLFSIKNSIYGNLPKGSILAEVDSLGGQVTMLDNCKITRGKMAKIIQRAVHKHSDYYIEFVDDIEYCEIDKENILQFIFY